MTAKDDANEEGNVLLERALADPFVLPSDEEAHGPPTHVEDWFRFLMEQFPLWAFQPHAFRALHDSGLPKTHPLPTIIRSILQDEGIDPDDQQFLERLVAEIDRRRYALLRDRIGSWLLPLDEEDDRLFPGWTLFLPSKPDLATWEPDTEHTTGGLYSPYEEIGRDLVALVEAREQATPGTEREKAKEVLEGFLHDLGVNLGKGRRPIGAQESIRKELVRQGIALFTLCWSQIYSNPSPRTRSIVRANKASDDPQEVEHWAAQLALPILSRREIYVLAQQVLEARRRGPGAVLPPTPEDFSVWVVARRLSTAATTLAKEFDNTTASNRFETAVNPFEDNA